MVSPLSMPAPVKVIVAAMPEYTVVGLSVIAGGGEGGGGVGRGEG